MIDISGNNSSLNPEFPNAPADWTQAEAAGMAVGFGLNVSNGHWDLVRALQEFFVRHEEHGINSRELHDALEERFHCNGGMKYLYKLFPGGPITQGCRMAGLTPPAGSVDKGFGSVQ